MLDPTPPTELSGHARRNAGLRRHALVRAEQAPPLARALVKVRAEVLGMTRLEFARRSGIGRGTLRDVELGVHTPTRRTLLRFIGFCEQCGLNGEQMEELRRLHSGPVASLGQFIARLELRAGSPRELARRVGISPATLWEYRRGNFPLPLSLLRRLAEAAGTDPKPAENLWLDETRQRLLARGYPRALAEFWALCSRAGHPEQDLPRLGLSMSAVRRLRYLELPPWGEVERTARRLCHKEEELRALQQLWSHDEQLQSQTGDRFGPRLKVLRLRQGIARREVADLFGIGGKKPARVIKHIEEDGYYSAQAYPAGLAALLADEAEQGKLLEWWRQRRGQFHLRHRPETRIELRLEREMYGFSPKDMEAILGYSPTEYQRIERGVSSLTPTAEGRILEAIKQAGQQLVTTMLQRREERETARSAWRSPPSVQALIGLLAEREGGFLPLARKLKEASVLGTWADRLRTIAQGREVPPWHLLMEIARACSVEDVIQAHWDWQERYASLLRKRGCSPLGVEVRLTIAEAARTPTALSARLGCNKSVLIRDLQRIDRGERVRWPCVERILRAAGRTERDERWRAVHAWWYASV